MTWAYVKPMPAGANWHSSMRALVGTFIQVEPNCQGHANRWSIAGRDGWFYTEEIEIIDATNPVP